MGMYCFITEQDRVSKRKVSDEYLNKEFQEALKYEPKLMIEERVTVRKRLFKKDIIETKYNILHESPAHDGTAYQARYQMSGSGDKQIVVAYLHGIINGALAQKL